MGETNAIASAANATLELASNALGPLEPAWCCVLVEMWFVWEQILYWMAKVLEIPNFFSAIILDKESGPAKRYKSCPKKVISLDCKALKNYNLVYDIN